MPSPTARLTGHEPINLTDLDHPDATVLDFWRWAFSDLRANNLRGIFAEWLVAKLLNLPLSVRDSWAGWDLETPEGVKIEVKTSAYLQSWSQASLSNIVFSGLKGQTWDPQTGYSGTPTFNADLYVFCVQVEQDASRWNALDLNQWRFYLVPREEIANQDYRTISLTTLSRLSPELTAPDFRRQALEMICRMAESGG